MHLPEVIDVAIIGGGASGTLAAAELLRQSPGPLRLALFERNGGVGLGRGLAYGTAEAFHLLNVPAARMSARQDDPEHFLRWLQREVPGATGATFAPRPVYGRYLQDVLREAEREAAPGCALVHVGDAVVEVRPEMGGVRLTLANGQRVRARRAVLALGNFLPAHPPVKDHGLYADARYVRSPWVPGALDALDADAPVLLVGTGLTMVDVALSLSERRHRGVLWALSRHGLLPQVHAATPPAPAPAPSPAVLARGARAALRAVREAAAAAHAAGSDWRAVVDALRPHTAPVWQALSRGERGRLLRHVRAYWEVHRHRMAPEVGAVLSELRARGQLRVVAGRVLELRPAHDGVRVRYRPRGAAEAQVLEVGAVVNCTGPASNVRTVEEPLLRGLLESGHARADAQRLGLDTRAGALVDAAGRVSPVLTTLGPLRRAELFESTAMPEVRAQARELAAKLLAELRPPIEHHAPHP